MRPFTGPIDRPLTRRNAGNFLLGIGNAVVLAGLASALATTTDFSSLFVLFVLATPSAAGLLAASTWSSRRYSDHARATGALLITLGGLAAVYPHAMQQVDADQLVFAPLVASLTFVGVVAGMLAGDGLAMLCLT
jgi:uncharacterized membrane protein